MTSWHQIRRVIAAVVAGITAALLQRNGVHFVVAVLGGIAAAVIVAGIVIPLVWKPPAADKDI